MSFLPKSEGLRLFLLVGLRLHHVEEIRLDLHLLLDRRSYVSSVMSDPVVLDAIRGVLESDEEVVHLGDVNESGDRGHVQLLLSITYKILGMCVGRQNRELTLEEIDCDVQVQLEEGSIELADLDILVIREINDDVIRLSIDRNLRGALDRLA
jgi:hypothetical protein